MIIIVFIILPRKPRTDVCDTCTMLLTEIKLPSNIADNPELVVSLQLKLDKHVEEADLQIAMLKHAEKDGPTRILNKNEWRTICTGK